jgi:hypothetical protein
VLARIAKDGVYVFFKTSLEKEWQRQLAAALDSLFFPADCYCHGQLLLVHVMKKHLPKDRQSFVDVQFLSG